MANLVAPHVHPVDQCCSGAECALLPHGDAEALAAVFKALADPSRVRILSYLADSSDGTVCACHLPAALGITQSTLSFHMRKLHEAGLVDREQRGKWAHWSIRPQVVAKASNFLSQSA